MQGNILENWILFAQIASYLGTYQNYVCQILVPLENIEYGTSIFMLTFCPSKIWASSVKKMPNSPNCAKTCFPYNF